MLNSKEFSDLSYSKLLDKEGIYSKNKMVTVSKCISLIPNGEKVLDIGCFNGVVLDLLRNAGFETYGVDASKSAVRVCQSKGHNVLECDLEKEIPFPDNSFDAVLGMEIIEHLADTDSLMREIKRVLKPEGVLILSTPNFFSLSRRIMTLIGINPYFEASFTFPAGMAGHLRFFTHDLLSDFLKFHNFKIIKSTSDMVNLSSSGKFYSTLFANLFPKLGRGVVISCQNLK